LAAVFFDIGLLCYWDISLLICLGRNIDLRTGTIPRGTIHSICSLYRPCFLFFIRQMDTRNSFIYKFVEIYPTRPKDYFIAAPDKYRSTGFVDIVSNIL